MQPKQVFNISVLFSTPSTDHMLDLNLDRFSFSCSMKISKSSSSYSSSFISSQIAFIAGSLSALFCVACVISLSSPGSRRISSRCSTMLSDCAGGTLHRSSTAHSFAVFSSTFTLPFAIFVTSSIRSSIFVSSASLRTRSSTSAVRRSLALMRISMISPLSSLSPCLSISRRFSSLWDNVDIFWVPINSAEPFIVCIDLKISFKISLLSGSVSSFSRLASSSSRCSPASFIKS